MTVVLSLAVAAAGGLLVRRFRMPGGVIVGALLATALASQVIGEIAVPTWLRTSLFLGVGVMIGTVVTRSTVRALRFTILPAFASAALLITAGICVALLLRALGIAPAGDVLATSPGALSVLTAVAVASGQDASMVALFHVTRVFLVMLSLPLITRLLVTAPQAGPPAGTAAAEPAGGDGRATGDPGTAGNPAPADDPAPAEAAARPAEGGEEARAADRRQRLRQWWSGARQLTVTAAAAAAGGLALAQTGLGGALVLGSTVAAALVTLAHKRPQRCPEPLMEAIAVGLGWMVGALMTPETMQDLRTAVVPAVLAGVLLISSGIAVSFMLRAIGHAPPGDVLATSPGSMEAVAATAVERGTGPLQVALFHTVRVLMVILSLPVLHSLL